MTFEEQIFGRRLSQPFLVSLRVAEVVFIVLGLLYIGGALHDALHIH